MVSLGLLAILSLSSFVSCSVIHLDEELCSFKSPGYSLQWAYEPHSRNVVFILKQKNNKTNFWTGVGFGDRKKEFVDFIGIFLKNGQIGIADTYIDPSEGSLVPDKFTNVQSIAFDYSNGTLTAKFARSIDNPDEEHDHSLTGCQILNFAVNGGSISRVGISPDFDEISERKICNIDENCLVDLKNSGESQNKSIKKKENPEFLHSVDISGTGDPCSFAGVGYTVNWTYNPETEQVDFTMKHPVKSGKWWSAVGIGDTMADMDIAIMFISSGRPKRIRDYFSSSYGVPEEDEQNDWILSRQRTKSVDGMIELGFSRKLETDDKDKDRSLDGCVLFQFAANGGRYGTGFAVRKHEEWPDLYKACDLKTHCLVKETEKRQKPEVGDSLDEDAEEVPVQKKNKGKKKKNKNKNKKPKTTMTPEETTMPVAMDQVSGDTTTAGFGFAGLFGGSQIGEVTTLNPAPEAPTSTAEQVLGSSAVTNAEGAPDSGFETTLSISLPTGLSSEAGDLILPTAASESSPGASESTTIAFDSGFIALEGATAASTLNPSESTTTASDSSPGASETTNIAFDSNLKASEATTIAPETASEAATTPPWTMPPDFVPMINGELNTSNIGAEDLITAPESSEVTKSPESTVTGTVVEGTSPIGLQHNVPEETSGVSDSLQNSHLLLPGAPEVSESTTEASQTIIISGGDSTSVEVSGSAESPTGTPTETSGEVTAFSGQVTSSESAGVVVNGGDSVENLETATMGTSGSTMEIMLFTLGGHGSEVTTAASESMESGASVSSEAGTDVDTESATTALPSGTDVVGLETTVAPGSEGTTGAASGEDTLGGIFGIEPSGNNTSTQEVPATSAGDVEIPLGSTPSSGASEGIPETTTDSSLGNIIGGFTFSGSGSNEATTVNPSESTGVNPSEPTTVNPSQSTGVNPSESTEVNPSESTEVNPSEATTADSFFGGFTLSGTGIPHIVEATSGELTVSSGETTVTEAAVSGEGTTVAPGSVGTTTSFFGNLFGGLGFGDSGSTSGAGSVLSTTLPDGIQPEATSSAAASGEVSTTSSANFGSTVSSGASEGSSIGTAGTSGTTLDSAEGTTGAPESASNEVEGSGQDQTTLSWSTDPHTTPMPGPLGNQNITSEFGPGAFGDPSQGCGADHEDFSLCAGYFQDYLQRVKEWADKNEELLENQYEKACTLLKSVKNVPSLCCRVYYDTCNGHIQF